MKNIDYNNSDSESNKILQLDGDDNEDYDLNNEIKEIILHNKLDEEFDKIIPNILENKDNKYTPCIIIDNDNNNYKIQ
ncbi:17800_t:CDS:2 [Cetraspora pellucida]|uniref:17800_t:CDS:1 n=1 Tax=Cetraspora pellucida TaxID=1433469 RepID=A0A9N9D115_9GLOM|nr:17800_t:CDS:2 [Cetraspora pellucida]